MTPLIDKFGNTIAYLHKKILIDPTCKTVLGLIVGNCVFGNKPEPIGKLFNNVIRDIDGSIIVKLDTSTYYTAPVNDSALINATWRILMQIKNHVCSWIPEMPVWSEKTLPEKLGMTEQL